VQRLVIARMQIAERRRTAAEELASALPAEGAAAAQAA
jgi:hypothetical protein